MRDFAKDVTSSSVLCLRIALTDIPILVDYKKQRQRNLQNNFVSNNLAYHPYILLSQVPVSTLDQSFEFL
jgi:hypothetical protein